MRPIVVSFLIAAAVASCLGCSSNNNSGGGSTVFLFCPSIDPDDPPTSGMVTMQEGPDIECGDALEVELYVTDVTDVFSISTTIEYDTSSLQFLGLDISDSELSRDGAQLNALANEPILGEITIGVSRNAPNGLDIAGSAKLATLVFAPLERSSGQTLTISTPCLTGSETPPVPKAGVNCTGGTTIVVEEAI